MVFWKKNRLLPRFLGKKCKNNVFEDKCFLSKMQAATNWSSHLKNTEIIIWKAQGVPQ